MKDHPVQFNENPLETSIDAAPERHSSLSEPVPSIHSPRSSSTDASPTSFMPDEKKSTTGRTKKLRSERPSFAYRLHDHVKLGPKLSETVKGKLSLGTKIIQGGGRGNIFKQIFGVREGEELLKASQCYLSTTDGPIAGLLFISTHIVAFCSERSISFPSPTGESIKSPYKVLIPIQKIERASRGGNVEKPAQQYIEIMTQDGFEFWFMGFLRYDKAFKNLQKAISMPPSIKTH